MNIPNFKVKSNMLFKILNILKKYFPKLFVSNSFGRPRKYKVGDILAVMIYKSKSGNLSFRKLEKEINNDIIALKILGLEQSPHFSVIFKIYTKFLKNNMNIFLMRITKELVNKCNTFYLDSSSLVTSKLDKEARFGKSTRLGYKLHLICTRKGIPITFSITTANIHDSKCGNLLENLSNLKKEATIIADKGYDSVRLLEKASNLSLHLICPLNIRKAKEITLDKIKNQLRKNNYEYLISSIGKRNYSKRWEIERLFGNLKENYLIDNHRIRGFSRKYFNVSLKNLRFTIEKVVALLQILKYFCNNLSSVCS